MSVADRGLSVTAAKADKVIATPPQIQPFAALIAVTSDWVITHISENIGGFLDLDASVLGHTLDHVLLDGAVHDIRGVLNATAGQNGMGRLLDCDLRHGYPAFDLTVHDIETGYILEVEPSEAIPRIDDIGVIRGLIDRVRRADTLEDVCMRAARSLRALTGFDRVVVCRVHADGRSTAIGEARMPGTAPLSTEVVMASDIISHTNDQLNSQLCMTADIDAALVPLVSLPDADPIDLAHAISEASSTDCTAFLRASDAKASFAVAIVQKGTLIGLIFCQHQKPLRTGFRTRMLVGLFADLFTYEFVAALHKTP